jgi:hypothetical protein
MKVGYVSQGRFAKRLQPVQGCAPCPASPRLMFIAKAPPQPERIPGHLCAIANRPDERYEHQRFGLFPWRQRADLRPEPRVRTAEIRASTYGKQNCRERSQQGADTGCCRCGAPAK